MRENESSEKTWTDRAHDICSELGTTPEEAEDAYERVIGWVSLKTAHRECQKSVTLPNGATIYRNQHLSGPQDRDWLVTGVNDEAVAVVQIKQPDTGTEPQFTDERTVLSVYEAQEMDAQTIEQGNGTTMPVYAY